MHQHQILDGLEKFPETIPWSVNIYEVNRMVLKNLQTIHPGIWMVFAIFFDTIQFAFVNIYIWWNGVEKPFETMQMP